ncbi:hypothetical protein XENORESO_012961 [Xenotaenia resolanae]|uniref:Uncharacterized protein n=1 Tax=Xenotaenia resolanae TaxID=208358 RepID=A0ABV0W8F1_9TELE
MSGMQQRTKWREGPLQPTHTCWASTPNLSESISSPPLVQSNHITLVSNQRISLFHSPRLTTPTLLFHSGSHFCVPLLLLILLNSVESAEFKKGNWFGQNVMGPPECSRWAARRIHLPKCSTAKCIMYIEPRSIILPCRLILCGRYQRCL